MIIIADNNLMLPKFILLQLRIYGIQVQESFAAYVNTFFQIRMYCCQ